MLLVGALAIALLGTSVASGTSQAFGATSAQGTSIKSITKELAKYEDPSAINFQPYMPKGKVTPKKGTKIAFVASGLGVAYQNLALTLFKQAAAVAGYKVGVFNGQFEPSVQAQQIQLAVQEKYAAIVLFAVDPTAVPSALAAADAANIPVVIEAGIGAHYKHTVDVDPVLAGRAIADWITVNSKGSAKVGIFTSPEFPWTQDQQLALAQNLGKICPRCQVTKTPLLIADALAPGAPFFQAFLNANPTLNYFAAGYDQAAVPLVNVAVQVGRQNIKVTGGTASKDFAAMIRSGQPPQAGISSVFPLGFESYSSVDEVARLLAGQNVGNRLYPAALYTQANAKDFNNNNPVLVPNINYKKQFATLWGVKTK